MLGLIFAILFILLLLGTPVAFSILTSGVAFLEISNLKPLTLAIQKVFGGLDAFTLLAVPLFIFAGNLMDSGGISKRIVKWAEVLVGGLPGGLGDVTIVACAIFAALTGSGPATVAAIGAIMLKSLMDAGYTRENAGGLLASAGALGPIIPPSIPMIIYGVNMKLSIPKMFIGGIIPGLFIAFLLIIVNTVIAKKSPEIMAHRGERQHYTFKDFLKTTWEALGALLMPLIILGGIYGGIFTPTEAASVAVAYALIVGFLVYKDLDLKKIPKMLVDSIETSAMVCFIIAAANLLSWVMTVLNMQEIVTSFLSTFIHNKVTYLLVLNLFLFFVGALMDNITTILLFAPVLVPIGLQFGINPLHLGVLFVINLTIGFVTPPFGYNLFTACSVTGLKFDRLIRGVLPFLIVEMAAVLVLAYVPWLITWLPSLLG